MKQRCCYLHLEFNQTTYCVIYLFLLAVTFLVSRMLFLKLLSLKEARSFLSMNRNNFLLTVWGFVDWFLVWGFLFRFLGRWFRGFLALFWWFLAQAF